MSPVPSEYDADDFAGQELLQPQETGRGHREREPTERIGPHSKCNFSSLLFSHL